MIILAAVTQNEFKKNKKDDLQYLIKPTSQTNEAMALKILIQTTLL